MTKSSFLPKAKAATETRYFEDGGFVTTLCSWERETMFPFINEKQVRIPGCVVINEEGDIRFKPYKKTGKPKYKILFRTEHGEIRLYFGSGRIDEVWKFPVHLPLSEIYEIRCREKELMDAYFMVARKEETWLAA